MAALLPRPQTRSVVARCQPGQEHAHLQRPRDGHAAPLATQHRGAPRQRQRPERAPLPHHVTDPHAAAVHAAAAAGPPAACSCAAATPAPTAARAAAEPWADAWRRAFPRALRGRRRAAHALTKALLAASVLPALFLAVQPLLPASAAAAVAVATPPPGSWQGPLRDMFSFTVLLSVFIGSEPGAAAASAASAAGAAIAMFSQGGVPLEARCTAGLLAAAAAVVLATSAVAVLGPSPGRRRQLRWLWPPEEAIPRVQRALGVLGGGLLLQFLATLLPGPGAAWLPPVAAGAAIALLAGACVDRSGDARQRLFLDDWPAWSATLLLILQPLRQLVETSLSSALLPAIAPREQLLLVLASGLMVPRALLMAELMWFTGTCSGALLAAGQLLVLAAHALGQRAAAALGGGCGCGGAAAAAVAAAAALVGLAAALGCGQAVLRAGWGSILGRRPYPEGPPPPPEPPPPPPPPRPRPLKAALP